MKTRICIKCNNTKPLDAFLIYTPNDPKASVAYSTICSTCRNRDREETNDTYNAGASINPKIVREIQTRATQAIKSAAHAVTQKKFHAHETQKHKTQESLQQTTASATPTESTPKTETKPTTSTEKSRTTAATTSLFGNTAIISEKALQNRAQNNAKANTTQITTLFSAKTKTEKAVATSQERPTNSK